MIESLHERLQLIERNPQSIANIEEPTEDEQLLAVNDDPTSIQFIKHPTILAQQTAVELDPTTIRFFHKTAAYNIRKLTLEIDPKVIKYLSDSTEEEQKFVISQSRNYYRHIPNRSWKTWMWQLLMWYKPLWI